MPTREELLAEAQRRGLTVGPSQEELRVEAIRRGIISDQVSEPEPIPEMAEQPSFVEDVPQAPSAADQIKANRQRVLSGLPFDLDIQDRAEIVPRVLRGGELDITAPNILVDAVKNMALVGAQLSGVDVGLSEREITNAAAEFIPGAVRGAGVASRAVPVSAAQAKAGVPTPGAPPVAVPGVSPEDAAALARGSRFEELGVPSTRGDITQEFAQQAEEQRLISMATGEKGEPLRQLKLQQSEAFIKAADDLVDSLGVPSRTGESVKAALTGRKDLLTKEKNALYKEVAETAPEVANVPIFTDEITKSMPDAKTMRRIRRLTPNTADATDDLLVEFGINKNPAAVEAFVKDGGEITPLNLGNSEEFRQALGQIERSDTTGATGVITGPIRRALDEESVFIDDALRESGITDVGVIATLKEARSRVTEIKTEFSPQAISGRLIGVKRDGATPIIEASKVTQELLRPNAPIENLQRTLSNLNKAGSRGKKAVQDLQASVVMDAMEAALKAPSRKTGGIETIGGNQFAKALGKFGDDKLSLLFRGNEKALNTLQNLKQTALDISPTAGAVPRGSAPVILDMFKRAGRLPGLAAIIDATEFVIKAGADDRAVAKALESKPKITRTLTTIRRDFPTIAERLGILTILDRDDQDVPLLREGEA